MSTLETQKVKDSYQFLLQIPAILSGSLVVLQTGDGSNLPLSLSNTTLKFLDTLDLSSGSVIGPIKSPLETDLLIRSGDGQNALGFLDAGHLDLRPGQGGIDGFFNGIDGSIRFLHPSTGNVVNRFDASGDAYIRNIIGHNFGTSDDLFKISSDGTDTEFVGYNGTVKIWAFDSGNSSLLIDGNGCVLMGGLTVNLPGFSTLPVLTIKEYESQTENTFRILTKDNDLRFNISVLTGTLGFFGSSSTTPGCNIVDISRQFSTSTHASRTGELTISPYYTTTAQPTLIIRGDSAGNSKVIVRKGNGTAGTDEFQMFHDGTRGYIDCLDGPLRVRAPNTGSGNYFEVYDLSGNVMLYIGGGSSDLSVRNGINNGVNPDNWSLTGQGRFITRSGVDFRHPSNTTIDSGLNRGGVAGVIGLNTNGSTTGNTLRSYPLTPAQITSNQNNYNPGMARNYRLDANTAVDITGLAISQVDGLEIHTIFNISSNNITFKHQDTNSTDINRFLSVTGADIVLAQNEGISLLYDDTTDRWRIWKL